MNPSSLGTSTRIDRIATAFDRACHAGRRPRLEALLDKVPEGERVALLEELLRIELQYRVAAGERPEAVSYVARFPSFAEAIKAAFRADGPLVDDALPEAEARAVVPATDPVAGATITLPPDRTRSPTEASPEGTVSVDGDGITGPPSTLGRFQMLGVIDHGGQGIIYRSRDQVLGREVALKTILPKYADDAEMSRRLVVEAQVGSQLDHPGIAPVHELGHLPDGRPYFAMKLIRGRTLEAILRQRSDREATLDRDLSIFVQICRAVDYAHRRGVIHRDLKPANVMVGAFGEVQVMDWGLAKIQPTSAAPPDRGGPTGTRRLICLPARSRPSTRRPG